MKDLNDVYKKYKELTKNDIDLEKFNNYSIIHHSNSIEGSTLTLDETILLLEDGLTPKNKPLQHSLMAVDHLEALKYTIDLADKKELLTVEKLQTISGKLQKNTGQVLDNVLGKVDSTKGDFRNVNVRAGTSTFKAKGIKEKTTQLIEEVNNNIKKVNSFEEVNKLAFNSHFILVSIHPFLDGNGRSSRLLMNYIQRYHKKPLTIINQSDKSDYFKALVETRENKNPEIFQKFMFDQTKKMMLREIENHNKNTITQKIKGMSFIF